MGAEAFLNTGKKLNATTMRKLATPRRTGPGIIWKENGKYFML
jgi:hypothetical protein